MLFSFLYRISSIPISVSFIILLSSIYIPLVKITILEVLISDHQAYFTGLSLNILY